MTFSIYYRIVSRPVPIRLISILLVAGVIGCSDKTPARIALPSDTVIVNTTMIGGLGAQVVNRDGVVLPRMPIRYSTTTPDSIAIVYENGVQCRHDGVTRVMLSAGRLTSPAMVRCHIIEKLVAEGVVCTRLGDSPVPMSVAAFDHDGNAIPSPRIYIKSDSTFVRVANGFITPLKAGDGDVDYTSGRRRAVTLLRVLDTAAVVDSSRVRIIQARDEMFEPVCARLR